MQSLLTFGHVRFGLLILTISTAVGLSGFRSESAPL